MKARIDNLMKVARESGKPNQWRKQYESLAKIIVGDIENMPYLHLQWNAWVTEIELEKWDAGFTEQIINGGEEVKKPLKDSTTSSTDSKLSSQEIALQNSQLNSQLNSQMNGLANYNAYDLQAQQSYSQQAHENYMAMEKARAEYYNNIGQAPDPTKQNLLQKWMGRI